MCARYVSKATAEWERWFQRRFRVDFASYNIVPTQSAPIVRAGTEDGELLRFGLVPFFCRGAKPKNPNINATVERLVDAPSWRGPWKRGQRCLVIANGFYEPHVEPDGRRRPFYIHLAYREAFAFAGIWDRSVADDGTAIESFAIITLPASPLMASIHNDKQRMPAILAAQDHEQWLSGSIEAARDALKPCPDDLLVTWPVSTRVNQSNQNDAELILPMEPSYS
ncbi:MAG TPA: SOS response-associated peptidase [Steroidobacteraceae bacterium]|jgi:putative SOS response-associated peptidase YedK|nr:SOS response-associated peptidase [Steroidobacteraceae bacterium]